MTLTLGNHFNFFFLNPPDLNCSNGGLNLSLWESPQWYAVIVMIEVLLHN